MTDISTPKVMGVFNSRFHAALGLSYFAFWVVMAVDPNYREDWWLENILVFAGAVLIVWLYPRYRFSDKAWLACWVFMICHTIGSHYTYAEAPPGYWMKEILSLDRNHYDRVIHFSFGLLMFWPMREMVTMIGHMKDHRADWLTLSFVVTISALYELMEWAAAVIVAPEAAIAFLGTQGDVFDAQKDTGLAVTGGLIAFTYARMRHPRITSPRT